MCGPECGESPLSTIEWYLVFAVLSMVLTQLPNLNSIVGLSLIGAVTAISYCILLWALSITRQRPSGVSYGAEVGHTPIASIFTVLNALGIIAFSFRGHNTVMEIQVGNSILFLYIMFVYLHTAKSILMCIPMTLYGLKKMSPYVSWSYSISYLYGLDHLMYSYQG